MDVNVAALTLMCLAFSTGFLLVVSFIEKPIIPLLAMPHVARENESDVRWIHSLMKDFLAYTGPGIMLPVTICATFAAGIQTWQREYEVVSVFVVIGAALMMIIAGLIVTPAAHGVRKTKTYEDALEVVAKPLLRLARMHHTMLLGLIPLTLAQLALLFY